MIKLVIPEIPPSLNELNSMNHWTRKDVKAAWVDKVGWWVIKQKVTPPEPILYSIVFYRFWFPNGIRRDISNLYGGPVKILEDGIVQAGLIKDDSIKHSLPIVLPMGKDKQNPRVEIEIHPVPKLDPSMIRIQEVG